MGRGERFSPFKGQQSIVQDKTIAATKFPLTEKPGCDAVAVLGVLEDGVRDGEGVPDHGAVEAVLGHDGRLAPALLSLTPLGSTVLEPHLKTTGEEPFMYREVKNSWYVVGLNLFLLLLNYSVCPCLGPG